MADELLPIHQEKITWFVPLVKSYAGDDGARILQGDASDEDWDGEDEQVLMDGMNFGPFLDKGYVNWNHKGDPQYIIGVPLEAEIRSRNGKPCFWIKAQLFDDSDLANYAWKLAMSLEKLHSEGGPERRLGWSIEGGISDRENGRIKKCVVRMVALTHEPINARTFAEVAKSFAVTRQAPFEEDALHGLGQTDELEPDDADKEKRDVEKGAENVLSSANGAPLKLENLDGGACEPDEKSRESLTTILMPAMKSQFAAKPIAAFSPLEIMLFLAGNDLSETFQETIAKAWYDAQLAKSGCSCGHGPHCDCPPGCACGCNAAKSRLPSDSGKLDTAARDSLADDVFADRANRKFPIRSANDAKDAWDLSGHAANPAEVRRNIKRLARKHGYSLPATAGDHKDAA